MTMPGAGVISGARRRSGGARQSGKLDVTVVTSSLPGIAYPSRFRQESMDSALLVHRIHFAFTITFHYLFPQLTMGLAPLIVVLKTVAIRCKNQRYNEAARFWAKVFAVNFLLGVVTGIPMEFQFGTNWSRSEE